MNLQNEYEKETKEDATYRMRSSDYHTLRYVTWIEEKYKDLKEINKQQKEMIKGLEKDHSDYEDIINKLENPWVSVEAVVSCDCCGRVFIKKTADISRTNYNFCNKKCSGKYFSNKTLEGKYIKDKTTLCWNFNGAINATGYGVFRYGGKVQLAHRASYIISCGEIPDGLHVLHRCDNPLCVNPSHLFLGTHLDNMKDMSNKGRRYRKIETIDYDEIKSSKDKNKVLAEKFNCSERTIRRIKSLPKPPIKKP